MSSKLTTLEGALQIIEAQNTIIKNAYTAFNSIANLEDGKTIAELRDETKEFLIMYLGELNKVSSKIKQLASSASPSDEEEVFPVNRQQRRALERTAKKNKHAQRAQVVKDALIASGARPEDIKHIDEGLEHIVKERTKTDELADKGIIVPDGTQVT